MEKLFLVSFLLSGCTLIVSSENTPSTQEAPKPPTNEDVAYLSVSATPTPNFVPVYELNVKIALQVNVQMSNVAPHVEVLAECKIGTETYFDKENAFFSTLSNASPGTQKEDFTQLFRVKDLRRKPDRCELTLQLTEGKSTPQHFCYQNDKTTFGKCPTP